MITILGRRHQPRLPQLSSSWHVGYFFPGIPRSTGERRALKRAREKVLRIFVVLIDAAKRSPHRSGDTLLNNFHFYSVTIKISIILITNRYPLLRISALLKNSPDEEKRHYLLLFVDSTRQLYHTIIYARVVSARDANNKQFTLITTN